MTKLIQPASTDINLRTASFRVVADFTSKRNSNHISANGKHNLSTTSTRNSILNAVPAEDFQNQNQNIFLPNNSAELLVVDRRILEAIALTSFEQLRKLVKTDQAPNASDLATCRATVVGVQRIRSLEFGKN